MEKSKMKKFCVILGVLLVLLIPIGFLAGIVTSRESYKEEAVNNISTSWAGVQKINAPTLSLNIPVKDNSMYQHLKPQDYNTNVNIQTELRKKGIFTVPVYTAEITVKGNFKKSGRSIEKYKSRFGFKCK